MECEHGLLPALGDELEVHVAGKAVAPHLAVLAAEMGGAVPQRADDGKQDR